jgi:hypothetical protein
LKKSEFELDKEILDRLNYMDINNWIKVIFEAKNLILNPPNNEVTKNVSSSRILRKGTIIGDVAEKRTASVLFDILRRSSSVFSDMKKRRESEYVDEKKKL